MDRSIQLKLTLAAIINLAFLATTGYSQCAGGHGSGIGSSRWGTGSGVVVTWSFVSSSYTETSEGGITVSPLSSGLTGITITEAERLTRKALRNWEKVADIKFQEVIEPGAIGSIRIGAHAISGSTLGHAYFPNSTGANDIDGNVHMDNSSRTWTSMVFYQGMLHELGHALGLRHNNQTGNIMYASVNTVTDLSLEDRAHIQHLYGPTIPAIIDASDNSASINVSFAPRTVSIRTSAWEWIASGTGTNTYYLRTENNANPDFDRPADVFESSTFLTFGADVATMPAASWSYADEDSLGYSTIYVRLSDNTDPDSKDEHYVKMVPNDFTSVRNATYRWTSSGAGTNAYYLELAAGGDPSLEEPGAAMENETALTGAPSIASIAAGEYIYGDFDTLGYETLYVRLSDNTDPDSKAIDYVVVPPAYVCADFIAESSLVNGNYFWVASSTDSNIFFVVSSSGTNPNLNKPTTLTANSILQTEDGDGASMPTSSWFFGDLDGLGYSTVYMRLTDSTDPDTKSDDHVMANYSSDLANATGASMEVDIDITSNHALKHFEVQSISLTEQTLSEGAEDGDTFFFTSTSAWERNSDNPHTGSKAYNADTSTGSHGTFNLSANQSLIITDSSRFQFKRAFTFRGSESVSYRYSLDGGETFTVLETESGCDDGGNFSTCADFTYLESGSKDFDLSSQEGKTVLLDIAYTNSGATWVTTRKGVHIDQISIIDVLAETGSYVSHSTGIGPRTNNYDITGQSEGKRFAKIRNVWGNLSGATFSNTTLGEVTGAPASYAVTYDDNNSTSGSAPAGQTKTHDVPLSLQTNSGNLARTGHTFAGWNTTANGSGSDYAAGAAYAANAVVTLYAQWTANAYTVTFDRQSGTGGSANISATYNSAMPAASAPTRSGYSFSGYYSGTNGSGTQYYTNAMASATNWDVAANTTLYANWTANSYTVTFDKQSGTGGSANISATYNSAMPAASAPNRTGYTFAGYYSGTSGSGTQYYTGAMASANTWDVAADTTIHADWTANTYTVDYDGNSNTGGTAPSDQTKTHDVDLTLATAGSLVRTGYTFSGWNTAANGSGTAYAASGTYSTNAADTLFAQWTPDTYTVSYDGNGNTSGTAPGDQTKTHDVDLTLATAGTLVRTGYTFSGWNTAANGSGTPHAASATYSTNAADTLFAQWTPDTYAVSYDGNGNTSGTAPSDQTKTHDVDLTLATAGTLVRTGYTFSGWNTAANGSGTPHAASATYSTNAADTLFAQWTPDTYAVSYDGNGNTSGTAPSDQTKTHDVDLTLATAGTLVRTGYTFSGWNTAANGSGTPHAASATYSTNAADTLFAQWTPDTYAVSYDGNGNTSGTAPSDQTKTHDVDLTLATAGTLVRTGYTFSGWNTEANGSGTPHAASATYSTNAADTLFAQWTPDTYTVSYDGNGNTSGTAPGDQTKTHDVDLTLATAGTLVRTGYTFSGWNTAANGSGTPHAASATYSTNAADTLFAQWTPDTYAVSYDGNGNTSGTAPSDQTKTHDVDLTLATAGTLVRTGYTFSGWNTEANGSGTPHAASATYSTNAADTLFAQWTPDTYAVSYDGNGNTSGTAPSDQTKTHDVDLTLATAGTLVRTGYTFSGWNTEANGSGTAYAAPATYSTNAADTLFAQWTPDTYAVSYDGNGNTSGTAPSDQTKTHDVDLTLATAGTLVRTGYTFSGWNTAANGSGTPHAASATYSTNAADTLFAQWTPDTYTVSYDGNGNTSGTAPGDQTKTHDVDLTLATAGTLVRTGYTFSGWNTAANGSGTPHAASATYSTNAADTLFAQWTPDTYAVSYDGNGNTSGTAPSDQTKTHDVDLTLATAGTLVRTGYTFSGWNTAANGSGTAYAVSSDYTANTAATLFATWSADSYAVTYDANNSTSGSAPADQTKIHDVTLALRTNSGNLARTGYSFAGWNTLADGSGTDYPVATDYTANAVVTLFAKWTLNTYAVTYDANNSTSGSTPATQSKTHGITLALRTNTGNLARTNYGFGGWNTEPDGSGDDYNSGSNYTANAAVILYAKWIPVTYAVTYQFNAATSGTPPIGQTKTYNIALTLRTNTDNLARTGYSFVAWNTADDGTGTDYAVGGEYTANASAVLYPKWIPDTYAVTYNTNGSTSGSAPAAQTKTHDIILTLRTNSGNLARTGYSFVGWSTADDGNGGQWAGGADYTDNTAAILFARWTPDTYAVTYDDNNSTSGSAPNGQTQTHDIPLELELNYGNLARTGYSFAGWNTTADGTGTDYPEEATYNANTAVTLFAKWTPDTYAVTYDANNSTSGSAPADQTKTHDVTLALRSNSGDLARTGYSFTGWNTADDGSGSAYAVGTDYTANAVITLYAKWTLNTYAVSYNTNEATSGSAPANQSKAHGITLALRTNTGNLARTNYGFGGWNTEPDGSGDDYNSGSDYTANAAVTLYAKWIPDTYSITYQLNAATSGTPPISQTKTYEVTLTLRTNADNLARTGYTFAGWNTADDGTGTDYAAGAEYTTNASAILYPKWIINTYAVTYSANDATSGSAPANQSKTHDVALALRSNSGNLARTNYGFGGWNTEPDGTGDNYGSGSDYTANVAVTLYPKWIPDTYSITYQFNAATSGTPPIGQIKTYNIALTLRTNTDNLARTGYTFAGWNTADDGTGTDYAAGAEYTTNASAILYPKWTPVTYEVAYDPNNATSGSTPTTHSKTHGITLTLHTNTGNLARTGYTFDGWNTTDNDTGTDYAAGAEYTENAVVTLYAKWMPDTYTVTYDGNGNTGGSAPIGPNKIHDIDLTLEDNYALLVRPGYTFIGWNTAADGTGTDYAEAATYSANTAIVLFAKWAPDVSLFSMSRAATSETLYFGTWQHATSGDDTEVDFLTDAAPPTIWLENAKFPAAQKIASDIRPPSTRLQWTLKVTPGENAAELTWDTTTLADTNGLFLQPIQNNLATGVAVSMGSDGPGSLTVTQDTEFLISMGEEEQEFIVLERGWNWISAPLVGTATLADFLAPGGTPLNLGNMWRYNERGRLVRHFGAILPERGALVFSRTGGESATVTGIRPDGIVPIYWGWNALTMPNDIPVGSTKHADVFDKFQLMQWSPARRRYARVSDTAPLLQHQTYHFAPRDKATIHYDFSIE